MEMVLGGTSARPFETKVQRYDSRMRTKRDIEGTIRRHADTVMRVCSIYLRDQADRDDAFQETFLRYARYERSFNGDEHRKAWLIRVASNVCKDQLKSASARTESLDALTDEGMVFAGDDGEEAQRSLECSDVLKALRSIDERYAIVLYLRFYENYTAVQIGKLLGMPENTVYTNIARGKRQLKGVLGHE
ncbi:MAG: sigma-70 family RNA polymerase sigma factor [Atopobiaceae bacterium]|nr:sigma-70 family RNA polymerase sigma factor [Atopobiaceae bacterium]